jgi:DNA-binding protein HU-beta
LAKKSPKTTKFYVFFKKIFGTVRKHYNFVLCINTIFGYTKHFITMNKGDLIDKIAEGAGLKKTEAAAALNATLEAITNALKGGEKITLVGFGSLDVAYRSARKGINPSTQKEIKIGDKVTVKFKAGKELAAAVDNKTLKTSLKKEDKKPAKKK